MRIDIMTLFPDSLGDVLSESILGRAQERGFIRIEAHQIRDYTASKQCQVDDYPVRRAAGGNFGRRTRFTGAGSMFATRRAGRCIPSSSLPAVMSSVRQMPSG